MVFRTLFFETFSFNLPPLNITDPSFKNFLVTSPNYILLTTLLTQLKIERKKTNLKYFNIFYYIKIFLNLCNCQNSDNCLLDNKCLTSKIVYSAEVITNNPPPSKFYLGICKTEFKTRFNNHKLSFSHRQNEKDAELSKYIWELKDQHTEYQIGWSIAQKSSGYPVTKSCNLCLLEKLLLCNFSDKSRIINKQSDLVSKCRHENK